MKFKSDELIWEAYIAENMEMGGGMEMPENDGAAMVMEFEPAIGEVEETEGPEEIDIAVYVEIKKLAEYSDRIFKMCQETELEPWMLAQLVKASSWVSDVWHQLDASADFANSGFEQSDNIDIQ